MSPLRHILSDTLPHNQSIKVEHKGTWFFLSISGSVIHFSFRTLLNPFRQFSHDHSFSQTFNASLVLTVFRWSLKVVTKYVCVRSFSEENTILLKKKKCPPIYCQKDNYEGPAPLLLGGGEWVSKRNEQVYTVIELQISASLLVLFCFFADTIGKAVTDTCCPLPRAIHCLDIGVQIATTHCLHFTY